MIKAIEIENGHLSCSFPYLESIPWHRLQLLLFLSITVEPKLNFPENHFHKNGLWTCPTAKHPSKHNGEEDNKNHEG